MKAKNTSSLASMLNSAYNAAEDTGEGNHKKIADGGKTPQVQTPVETPVSNPFVVQQPQPVQQQPQIVQQPVQQPVPQVQSVTPVQQQPFTVPEPPKKQIIPKTQSTGFISQNDISKVIDIYTYYMNMDDQVKETTLNFLNIDTPDPTQVVYAIFNVDMSLLNGLDDLVNLRQREALERGFDLLSLENERLMKLSELTLLFVDDFKVNVPISNRIEYCRILVKGMERIPMKALNFLAPVSELLQKGK